MPLCLNATVQHFQSDSETVFILMQHEEEIRKSCENAYLYGNSTMTSAQCDTLLQQGVDKRCGIEAFGGEGFGTK